jgi:hypothetical protein
MEKAKRIDTWRRDKSSSEVRELAGRMVQEQRGEYPSLRVALEAIDPKIGCRS